MLHFIHEGMGFFIIGYLSLFSLHFYYPITLAYVTSRVLRPPWGHGIKCLLRQPLLGQVFKICLIFGYHHASSSGRRLFDVLTRFSCGYGWLGSCFWLRTTWYCLILSIYHKFDVVLGHISFSVEIYRSSWSFTFIPICEMHTETRTCSLFYHDPPVEPLLIHLVRPIFFSICMSPCFLF